MALGQKILDDAPDAVLYLPERYGPLLSERVRIFSDNLRTLLTEIYPQYAGFVFLMATGIVVRLVAELIKDKRDDPAIVVMDITGRFAISLVSGHLGGANLLAGRMAAITGATAVVTTGTDVCGTIAPDLIAQEIGGEVDDFEAMKRVSTALIDGERTAVLDLSSVDPPSLREALNSNVERVPSLEALAASPASAAIVITNRLLDLRAALPGKTAVILRPKNLIVGVGCHRGTSAEEIVHTIRRVLADAGLSAKSVRALATVKAKQDEAGLLEAARRLGLPIEFRTKEVLNAVESVPNPSEAPIKFVGVQGVAEPSALLVSGGRLVVEKVKSGNVTVAIADMKGAGREDQGA
jgi:cobalt-precorrin 5A hydrolase